jgi:hypothetical protein
MHRRDNRKLNGNYAGKRKNALQNNGQKKQREWLSKSNGRGQN